MVWSRMVTPLPLFFAFLFSSRSASAQLGLTTALANELTTDIGAILDMRPYEPATPLGISPGFDIGAQVVVGQLPSTFWTALSNAGMGAGSGLPIFPAAAFTLHKGLGDIDIGGSYLWYQDFLF